MSICVPVHNGADRIESAFAAIAEFDYDGPVHVVCVANGCTDDSAERARQLGHHFEARGWRLTVFELPEASKPAALRLAESASSPGLFAALDVNVRPTPDALRHMVAAVASRRLKLVSAQLRYVEGGSALVRRFVRTYACAPYARSGDLKGTFILFTPELRGIVRTMPDAGADDRYFLRSVARTERSSVQAATVDYHFPDRVVPLIRQQIRWKRSNRALDRMLSSGDGPSHAEHRWPYLDPVPPLSAAAVYFAVTLLASVAARLRPRHVTAWSR